MVSVRLCVVILLAVSLVAGEIKEKGWWKNTVFYQVYPRSFMDSNGDGIGDLKGITSKLEHFKESGIGGIWLSPIYASPMVDFGYDISDFRAIDDKYGTMADLEELTMKAKELGIKVIMDLVPNHTSDKHEWFQKSIEDEGDYKDYYIWRSGANAPNNWISVFGGPAWTKHATNGLWYFHQFERRQPDLNYANPKVQQEMKDIITFWLNKGIDGFRIDAIPHVYERNDLKDEPKSNTPGATEADYTYLDHIYTKDDPRTYELIKSWRTLVDEYADSKNQSEKVLMTEAYTNLRNTTKYYEYGSNVPFNFNFIMNVNKNSKPSEFFNVITEWMDNTPAGQSANWVMGNHDRSRTATRYPGRADQMTMLSMILPGIAVTYNGEEIAMEDNKEITWKQTVDPQGCIAGEEHYQERSRDPNRTPFQWDDTKNAGFSTGDNTWLPVHKNFAELNLKKQKSTPVSHYNLYRNLTKLRSESEALKTGSLNTEVSNSGSVLSVVRQGSSKNETVVLLINFSDDKAHNVSVQNYVSTSKVTVFTSSIGSKIPWNEHFPATEVQLPAKASVVIVPMNGALSVTPLKIILTIALAALYELI